MLEEPTRAVSTTKKFKRRRACKNCPFIKTCLQGSVVVFTSYSSWTYTDPASDYYCHKTPMVFAFVLLLIKVEEHNISTQYTFQF